MLDIRNYHFVNVLKHDTRYHVFLHFDKEIAINTQIFSISALLQELKNMFKIVKIFCVMGDNAPIS